tara:strand:- start:9563 stop:9934 length:372 start_codon:yes stop_codon:yes gene_type:complete
MTISESPSSVGSKMIDWAYVNGLRAGIGKDSFNEIVQVFFDETEDTLKRLEDAHRPIDITEELHFLQGSALNMGFVGFSAECRKSHDMSTDNADDMRHTAGLLATYGKSKTLFLSALSETGLK